MPVHTDLPPWPSGLAILGRGAVKAWLHSVDVGDSTAINGGSKEIDERTRE